MKVFLTLLVLFSWNHTYSQWLISDHTEGQGSGIGAFDAMNFGMTDLGGVSLTVDGGETFIHYDFIDADENLFDSFLPNDLEYFSPNIIYCSGQIPFVSREIVAKSIDGGSTWEFIYYEPGEGILNDLHITQAGTIFIV
ncbi:MAG: hypothetical protein ACPGED_07615, partial [Flavobacteriales bacterium]